MDKIKEVKNHLKNLPNQLSLVRIAAIPFLLFLYPLNFQFLNILCALVFLVAAVTDFLDGYLARKHNTTSFTGAILDQLADKMLVTASFVLLASSKAAPAWMCGLLLCREMAIAGLRHAAAEKSINISVNSFGKLKTFFQDLAIFCLFINYRMFDLPFREVGMISLWIALALSLYSAYVYGELFWKEAKNSL